MIKILSLCCFLIMATMQSAQALTINTIRGAAGPDKTRLVIELDQIADFRAYVADAPARLVVELPDAHINDTAAIELGALGISQMKQSSDSRLMTLAFMLRKPVKMTSAFMLPADAAAQKPDRLVIDYKPASATEFAAATAQMMGTLPGKPGTGGTENGILGTLSRATSSGDPSGDNLRNPTPAARAVVPSTKPSLTGDAPVPKSSGPRKYVVVIDAGHGGKDPGAIGSGVMEKNITLAAARELARILAASGRYTPVMTRDSDRFILLPDRVKIARAAKADLFISLHADMAVENKNAKGLSIYTLSDTASDAQTEKLAASENKVDLLAGIDLSHEEEDVANILIDLAMRDNMNQSRFFAGKVVSSMNTNGVDLIERPHRYAGFAVLKAPDIPSVLVEMGFLSNRDESNRLQNPDHRHKLMASLARGIGLYFDYLEKNSGN